MRAGEPLMDGPIQPARHPRVMGEKELQRYLVNKIQEVYRSQGVAINDKHIEVIVRQMMRSVQIEDVGDTEFLVDEQVDRFRFEEENERVLERGGQAAHGAAAAPRHHEGVALDGLVHLGRVVPGDDEGPDRGVDRGQGGHLRGLKENVIVGRLIPAGTGMDYYRNVVLEREEIPPAPRRRRKLYFDDETPVIAADLDDEV